MKLFLSLSSLFLSKLLTTRYLIEWEWNFSPTAKKSNSNKSKTWQETNTHHPFFCLLVPKELWCTLTRCQNDKKNPMSAFTALVKTNCSTKTTLFCSPEQSSCQCISLSNIYSSICWLELFKKAHRTLGCHFHLSNVSPRFRSQSRRRLNPPSFSNFDEFDQIENKFYSILKTRPSRTHWYLGVTFHRV
jgi:hypothetical protein